MAGSSDRGLAAVGERQWLRLRSGLPSGTLLDSYSAIGAWSPGKLRGRILEVLAGQTLIGSLAGQAERYSGKVQATGVDLAGLVCTLWDGDLRR
jgi:hypothetical protein